jgi:Xaa-Pro aminopeptidase
MDYTQRKQNILEIMQDENADWFFVTNLTNVRYLSGFTGSHGILLIHPNKQIILTDGRYTEQVSREVSECEPIIQGNRTEMEALKDAVGDLSSSTVWFESEHVTVSWFEELRDTLSIQSLIGKSKVVEGLRSVKDDDEIKCLRQALHLAEQAFQQILNQIHEGMTERELAHALEHEMWKAGAIKESFESLILFGPRSSMCHGQPSNNTLNKGDIVLMDFGCMLEDGYCSDITRTVFFGDPGEEMKEIYSTVLNANVTAEEKIHAGMTGIVADEFARTVIRNDGVVDLFVHGLGHGVGLDIHEAPRLSPLGKQTLLEGNVVTVEPGLYIPDVGGIRIEDMIVIHKNDCEVLNTSSKEMIIL